MFSSYQPCHENLFLQCMNIFVALRLYDQHH